MDKPRNAKQRIIAIRKLKLEDVRRGTGFFETLRNMSPSPVLPLALLPPVVAVLTTVVLAVVWLLCSTAVVFDVSTTTSLCDLYPFPDISISAANAGTTAEANNAAVAIPVSNFFVNTL